MFCMSYHHVAWCMNASSGVCLITTQIRSLWHSFHASLTQVHFYVSVKLHVLCVLLYLLKFTFTSNLVAQVSYSYHHVALCMNAFVGVCYHSTQIRSCWHIFHASLTGSLFCPNFYLMLCMSYHHVAWCMNASLEVFSWSLWPSLHASLTLV